MGLKVVNVYRALPAPAVFPTFATTPLRGAASPCTISHFRHLTDDGTGLNESR